MSSIYLGRIVGVGLTPDGRPTVIYRVSSRSFPNRRAVMAGEAPRSAAILPKPGHEADALVNPYIAYTCARLIDAPGPAGRVALLTNGSQTDPIADKIQAGYPVRDAFALGLLAMDYEKDAYNTPRIAAAASVGPHGMEGWLGVVRDDGLDVRRFALTPGEFVHVSTYEHNVIRDGHPAGLPELPDADAGCVLALDHAAGPFAPFTHPVTAVCAWWNGEDFSLASREAAG